MKTFVNNLQKIRKGRRKMSTAPHCRQRKEEKKEAQCRSRTERKKGGGRKVEIFPIKASLRTHFRGYILFKLQNFFSF
jgi:hypothetical protein